MAAQPRPVTPLGILTQKLASLADRVAADDALRVEVDEIHLLAQGLEPYLTQCSSPESSALRELAARTAAQDWTHGSAAGGLLEQEMLSGHIEGQLLKLLVHATRATRVLEIGMFTGYSALAMAEALPAAGALVACEIDPFVAEFAKSCFAASPAGTKIEVRVGPALDTLRDLAAAGAVFDLVFVDADKGGYRAYLDALLDTGLLAPHAIVCVDNTLMQGQPYGAGELTDNGRAIAAFNRSLAADPRVEQVLLPLRDGLTLIRRVADPSAASTGR